MIEPATGRLDAHGRLISAEPGLLRLQQAAGGDIGDPLLVPALARLASLSQSLGINIARQVVIADENGPQDVAAEARPDNDSILLSLGDQTPRIRISLHDLEPADTNGQFKQWHFAFDPDLRLTDAIPELAALPGEPLLKLVCLHENDLGDMPLLGALGARTAFEGQSAILRTDPAAEFTLSGEPRFDESGIFLGFFGVAKRTAPFANIDALPPDTRFADRLDRALRGPLGRIAETADAIRTQTDGPLRRDYADYAGDIASAARHLLALADDLSDLEAIERPDYRPEVETLDLTDLVRRAAGLLRVRASDRKVRIDPPTADEILNATGEFRRVLQILVNLIGNAVRYSPEGSMVWLRLERDEDTAVVVVADQGKGIAIDDQERIFEKFERVDPSEPGGNGLGLYIARRLARAMGGDIAVDSAPGQGARFVLTLPVVA